MNNGQKLYASGQSIWYDNIQRTLLQDGSLKAMIDEGKIYGLTSNPSIFNNAIVNSTDYDVELKNLAGKGLSAYEIYEALAVADIQAAADLLLPVYEQTNKIDGYVSLEVSPEFAHDPATTITEAEKLWKRVDRPNLMIKIPATVEGLEAVTETISKGINVNITLIFSIDRYQKVYEAYMAGLEKRLEQDLDISDIHSVASFFVSRMDSKVDGELVFKMLEPELDIARVNNLKGKAAIANTKKAYQEFLEIKKTDRYKRLEAAGANVQRPLWASTSTKNPDYPDTRYVDELIGEETVNTIPPKTLDAFLEHGVIKRTIEEDFEVEYRFLEELNEIGVDLGKVTNSLEKEGIASFSKAFASMINNIEGKI